jgi:hypothetical protein
MDPLIAGLVPSESSLLDERSRPDFRDVFGALARRSTEVATAVTRVRLSTLDLTRSEMEGVRRLRVLVAEVNALHLDAEARVLHGQPNRAEHLMFLTELLREGRLQVRSAPLAGWSPDFTVFSNSSGPIAVLAGYHWFERPYPHRGPALGSLHSGDAARLAAARYSELWEGAHDIGPAVWSILARARARAHALACVHS